MNLPTQDQVGADLAGSSSRPSESSVSSASLPGPIFLMTNSLETGGTERQFVEVAKSLRGLGCDVQLGCIQRTGAFFDSGSLVEFGQIAEFRLGGSLFGVQSMRSRWRLKGSLRRSKIAVAHAFDFYTNLLLTPSAKLAGVPLVVGSHRQLGDLLSPAKFRAQLAAFRWCDRVVCNSRAAADRLLQAGVPADKLVVIGNGLPNEAFAPCAPALERREGVLRVGMIARMNADYKNQRGFLQAAARLAAKFPHVEFVLVGDGPLRPDLERQAADLGLGNRAVFLGDRRDVRAILASLDVSVVPSASESLSNAMLESMAAGVPVVATAVGGNCELGADGRAQLVRPHDDEALAAALESVLTSKELGLEISYRARQFTQDNFSIAKVRDQYCNLYSDGLARRGSSRTIVAQPGLRPRVRVALVAPSLRYVGGQSVQADLLIQNWRGDPDVDARFVPVDPKFPFGLGWTQRVPFVRTVIRQPIYMLTLWRGLRSVDAAHIFSASYSSFLLAPLPAWLLARLRKKKTLINYHSGECRDHLRGSYIAREVLRRTDRLVVPSEYLVNVFREFGLTAKVVPNFVDFSQFVFRVRPSVRPHLVCTRGFHPYYCIDVVVRAFARVQETFPEARLDLVGGGGGEAAIRRLVREMNLTGVEFKGVAARADIASFYNAADIFINASRLDNMPVSILEAFACGLPVVTTEAEGMRYLVEHQRTGLLSPTGDTDALARNVIRVLQDSELADRLISNARREIERYSWPVAREQWLAVYRELQSGS
jgi:glycosyltransferase involved in cell wall biosynthesis